MLTNSIVKSPMFYYLKFYFLLMKSFEFKYLLIIYELFKFFICQKTKLFINYYNTKKIALNVKFKLNSNNLVKDDSFVLLSNMNSGISKLKLTYFNKSFQWFYFTNINSMKHVFVNLNLFKLFKLFLIFKRILLNLGFYSFYIFAFGTPLFKPEVNTINKLYKLNALNNFYFNFFHIKDFFADKISYTVEVDKVLHIIAKKTNRKSLFIVVQEKALASFFVQKVNLGAIGFFTYSYQKHSYGFLVPVFIENFYLKTAMYSYIFIYWHMGKKLALLNYFYYILHYKLYKYKLKSN